MELHCGLSRPWWTPLLIPLGYNRAPKLTNKTRKVNTSILRDVQVRPRYMVHVSSMSESFFDSQVTVPSLVKLVSPTARARVRTSSIQLAQNRKVFCSV
jgi:hypothetical protein